jgi:hypothetical protein
MRLAPVLAAATSTTGGCGTATAAPPATFDHVVWILNLSAKFTMIIPNKVHDMHRTPQTTTASAKVTGNLRRDFNLVP